MYVFILFFIFFSNLYSIDPLSKINISSKTLKLSIEEDESKNLSMEYKENVHVVLADETTINSNFLKFVLDKSITGDKAENSSDKQNNEISKIKKIFLEDNIVYSSKNRTVKADKAELFVEDKKFYLKGNVEVSQKKEKPKDLPIVIKGEEVKIDLNKDEVLICGTEDKVVETSIDLVGYPTLLKRIRTKEEKAQMRREARLERLRKKEIKQS